jgi:GDP/UDP-N,N'-diacetylbacillosamine 2-epimerase (hydrolysing)
MRKIIYVSGTRADFGLMRRTLQLAAAQRGLEVSVCATGMHLSPDYGETVREIEAAGLHICARLPVPLEATTGASMARAIGHGLLGMVDVFERERPDFVLVLGDRGEMLAGALAAVHLNIPVVHLHGGERSGTIDESVRHAISKLAHYHFAATPGARRRLVRMGEQPARVFVTGAPGLDGLREEVRHDRDALCRALGFDPARRVALVVLHPVLQEAGDAARQARELLEAVQSCKLQAVVLMPNADAGGRGIRRVLEQYRRDPHLRLTVHLPRADFVSWMAAADVMVGNSSSGIIEAASFGLPVVNVGTRQHGRERGRNVTDAPARRMAIERALRQALKRGHVRARNPYGDGQAGERIVDLLQRLPLNAELLQKSNAY